MELNDDRKGDESNQQDTCFPHCGEPVTVPGQVLPIANSGCRITYDRDNGSPHTITDVHVTWLGRVVRG